MYSLLSILVAAAVGFTLGHFLGWPGVIIGMPIGGLLGYMGAELDFNR